MLPPLAESRVKIYWRTREAFLREYEPPCFCEPTFCVKGTGTPAVVTMIFPSGQNPPTGSVYGVFGIIPSFRLYFTTMLPDSLTVPLMLVTPDTGALMVMLFACG